MSTTDDIAEILKSRNLDALKGLRENQRFDAKRAAGYNLAIAAGRFELARRYPHWRTRKAGTSWLGLRQSIFPTSRRRRFLD